MFLLVLWIVTLAIVVVGLLPPGDQEVARWSRRFNVPLHSTTVDLVRAQLRRGRSIRFAFFALGIHIGMLPMYMNVIDVKRASEFSNPLTGSAPYALAAVGAFLAELAMAMASRPGQVTGVRSAALVSRHWFDYIHSFWLLFVIACLPISLIAAWFAKDDEQTLGWIWVGPALTAVAILAATVGVSVVVNRPVVALASDTPGLDARAAVRWRPPYSRRCRWRGGNRCMHFSHTGPGKLMVGPHPRIADLCSDRCVVHHR
ncbi:MAG: hypothetical protein V9E94_05215 [Microthrixaceae bacterium]